MKETLNKKSISRKIYIVSLISILIKGDKVYINGNLLEEPYALYDHIGDDNIEIQIRENEYFVMGDNRYESGDSREYGPIPKENISYILIK